MDADSRSPSAQRVAFLPRRRRPKYRESLLQNTVANEFQGRVFGAFNTLQAIALLAGMVTAASLGDRSGIVPMILVDAACNLLAALLAFLLLHPPLRTASAVSGMQEHNDKALPGDIMVQQAPGSAVR
jgi:hypothetical protein